ncbi:T9SS type A sorting domain-containing protein [candidate division KSB1 bacterium]|nr:T9SS type A sorting domain-containing protein [candidate division KSB1 bacterium]
MHRYCYIWAMTSLMMISAGFGQILTPQRRIQWIPGITEPLPNDPAVVDVYEFGAAGDGVSDDFPAFEKAINSLPALGGIVSIPKGDFLIKKSLSTGKSVVFSGEGAEKSRLFFDLGGEAKQCIEFMTYQRGQWIDVMAGLNKDSDKLVVADAMSFKPGIFFEIQQDNDPDIMYTDEEWNQSWAQNAVGQIGIVQDVRGDTLFLQKPLYLDYRPELNPVIRTQGFVTFGGLKNLYISRLDAGDGHTVMFKNAAFCCVQNIESDITYRSHINFTSSYGCEVRDSYFHHSHDYGGGGHGYGVECGQHSTDNLVENSIFQRLRHSMMVHVGASGNVYAYNYSRENQSEGTWLPCDISLHGHYANFNLFESNIVQEIDVGDYWGPMGPGNTFLRNKIVDEGLDVLDHSANTNIIGNVFESGNQLNIDASVNGTLAHGNWINNAIRWDNDIADHDIPASYYLQEKPAFFKDCDWPVLGPDVTTESLLPAFERYQNGYPLSIGRRHTVSEHDVLVAGIYPNPFNASTVLEYVLPKTTTVTVSIYDVRGRLMLALVKGVTQNPGAHRICWTPEFSKAGIPAGGVYFLRLETAGKSLVKKVLFLK